MLAQAVLLVTSVTKVDTAAMMRLTSSGSRLWRREQGRLRQVLSGTHLQTIYLLYQEVRQTRLEGHGMEVYRLLCIM